MTKRPLQQLIILTMLIVFFNSSVLISRVQALSARQRDIYASGIGYFDIEESCATPSSTQSLTSASTQQSYLANAQQAHAFSGPTMEPQSIILHWTAGQYDNDPQEVIETLRNRQGGARQVQLYVDDEGDVHQLTETLETRAIQTMTDDPTWNDSSIGIEIESVDSTEIEPHIQALANNQRQYQSVIGVVRELVERYNMPIVPDRAAKRGVFGHFEANSGNSDPGQAYIDRIRSDLASSSTSAPPPTASLTSNNCSCSVGSSSVSGNLVGSTNAEKTWNFLMGKGLSAEQTAGLMGNLSVESGFDPFNQENGKPFGVGGWGLPQWTAGRRDAIRDAVISGLGAQFYIPTEQASQFIGTPAEDQLLHFQLNYLFEESNGRRIERGSNPDFNQPPRGTNEWEGLKTMRTVPESVMYWEWNYERAGVPALGARESAANELLALYGSGTSSATASPSGGGCGAVALDASGCPTSGVPEDQTVLAEGIRVHPCIAAEVSRLMQLARSQGLALGGGGWRSPEQQLALRRARCPGREYDRGCRGNPPTAVPGSSRHERGTAVDFTCNGSIFSSHSSPCFQFLDANTSLINFNLEAWHWSIDGR